MNPRADPRNWKLGMFYYNPSDPSPFVPKRSGIGTTINFASTAGKLFFIVLLGGISALALLKAFGILK